MEMTNYSNQNTTFIEDLINIPKELRELSFIKKFLNLLALFLLFISPPIILIFTTKIRKVSKFMFGMGGLTTYLVFSIVWIIVVVLCVQTFGSEDGI